MVGIKRTFRKWYVRNFDEELYKDLCVLAAIRGEQISETHNVVIAEGLRVLKEKMQGKGGEER